MFSLQPIGYVSSPYKEKFAIPRQARLVPSAKGYIEMQPQYCDRHFYKGLEDFSHIWVHFIFHQAEYKQGQTTVRPPRLGGNIKKGIFATRSPFRPNSLGLSAVELAHIEHAPNVTRLHIQGLDLLDGTPVVDIKPYLHSTDTVDDSQEGFLQDITEQPRQVEFAPQAQSILTQHQPTHPELTEFITQVLQLDPRPGYRRQEQHDEHHVYGMQLYTFNITWVVKNKVHYVLSIDPLPL